MEVWLRKKDILFSLNFISPSFPAGLKPSITDVTIYSDGWSIYVTYAVDASDWNFEPERSHATQDASLISLHVLPSLFPLSSRLNTHSVQFIFPLLEPWLDALAFSVLALPQSADRFWEERLQYANNAADLWQTRRSTNLEHQQFRSCGLGSPQYRQQARLDGVTMALLVDKVEKGTPSAVVTPSARAFCSFRKLLSSQEPNR